jgi:glycosyltransferase involved in cell wall biosynthesis
MAGEPRASEWLQTPEANAAVELLPNLPRERMADLFRRSQVMVSPTEHDGTPNTLLEAMACGCFPIAGDLESLREWILPGENGFLINPGDAGALAGAVLDALDQPELRSRAAATNARLVQERAEHGMVMSSAEEFYREIT